MYNNDNNTYPQIKILETQQCILRPATLDDASDMFEYYSQSKVVKYLPMEKHNSIADTKRFIKTFFLSNYKKGYIGHFAIVFKEDKKTIGNVGFNNISTHATQGEIGICINPKYWGLDLSTELAAAMLKYGFEDLNLQKIIATTFENNNYSRKSLEKLGFHYLGTFEKKFHSIQYSSVTCHRYEITRKYYFNRLHQKYKRND